MAADSLQDVKFLQEKKLISSFFSEIAQDTGKYVYGVINTLQGLDLGAVEKLICWENLDITRYTFKKADGTVIIKNLRPDQEKDKSHFIDPDVSYYKIIKILFFHFRLVLTWKLNHRCLYWNGLQTTTRTLEQF